MKIGTTPTIPVTIEGIKDYKKIIVTFRGKKGIAIFENPLLVGDAFECKFTQQQTQDIGVGFVTVEAQIIFIDDSTTKTNIGRIYNNDSQYTEVVGGIGGVDEDVVALNVLDSVVYVDSGTGTTSHPRLTQLGFDESGHEGFQRELTFSENFIVDSLSSNVELNLSTEVKEGDLRPVTSAAVDAVIGSVNALLKTI